AYLGAVVASVAAEHVVAEPAGKKDADDGGKANAEQIDAIVVRREQSREHEHAQQPQQCRKHVGGQGDAGLSQQHGGARPGGSVGETSGASVGSFSMMAARMISTGVNEKDATEKATSSRLARLNSRLSPALSSRGASQ